MEVRGWTYADIARIAELEKECFPQEPWSFQMLVSSFENEAFNGIVACDGDVIVGYGGITVACDSADIENVAVTAFYRNSGIGKLIVEKLVEIARDKGAQKVFLEVRVSNSVALGLYLKSGFNGVYARTRYYSDGEDCLVMMKGLGWRQ